MKLSNVKSAMFWSFTSIALFGIIASTNPIFGQKGKKKKTRKKAEMNLTW